MIVLGKRSIWFRAGETELAGDLTIPPDARGIVVFAHGTGSSRFSPRNRAVAETLNDAGLATLLVDLLTSEEERRDQESGEFSFNLPFLSGRLLSATKWLESEESLAELPLGYFGASTGAGSALYAAADVPERVGAIVSRGGRPDLAGDRLAEVKAPTLLIVGGEDQPVIPLNESALERLPGEKALEIIPGATHLFEEEGALERVADLAAAWFTRHL